MTTEQKPGYPYSQNPQFRKALELLDELFQQADEDTPSDCRSRHFRDTMEEVEDFLVKMGLRKLDTDQ